jgi:outer membrane biosynthesis protein TonB
MATRAQQRPQQRRGPASAPFIRSLRVGIILGGKIIEERLFRKRKPITVGQSAKNTFCVPTDGLPRSFPLFSVEHGQYTLHFTDRMDGRISIRGQVSSLEKLKGAGAVRTGNHWSLQLDDQARGKVVAGGMTLLFQFVNAPPLQARPRLPASVRGTLADRIDPHLAIIMAISLTLHLIVAVIAYMHDQVVTTTIQRVQQEFQEESFRERVAVSTFKVPTTAETTTEIADEPGDDQPDKARKPKKGGGGGKKKESGGGDDSAPSDAKIAEEIANTAFLKVATGAAGESRYSKMSETDQGAELGEAIKNVKKQGATVSSKGNPGSRGTRGPNSGKIGTGKGPQAEGIKEGDVEKGGGTKKEESIKSRARFDVEDLDMTTLDPNKVARKISKRYLAGIKRCHEQILKRDPKAGGRVDLKFTVGVNGRVTRKRVTSSKLPEITDCISKQMGRWSFGAPKDDDGNPTSAEFRIPVVLKPGG